METCFRFLANYVEEIMKEKIINFFKNLLRCNHDWIISEWQKGEDPDLKQPIFYATKLMCKECWEEMDLFE